MNLPLIAPDQSFAVWAVLLGLSAMGFWLDRTRLGRRISGVILMLVTAIILSNTGVIPKSAPAYGVVWSYLVPLAVPLLLLKADLRRVIPDTGGTLLAFLIGAVGTVLGALAGFQLLGFTGAEGPIVGAFIGTYIGGSLNFATIAQALQIDDSTLLAAAVAADNLAGTIYLLVLVALPSLVVVRRFLPTGIEEGVTGSVPKSEAADGEQGAVSAVDMSVSLFISLIICALGYGVASWLAIESYGILLVTAFAVAAANVFPEPLSRLRGDFEIGQLFMFVFLATIGAGADIGALIEFGPILFAFAGILLVVHLICIVLGSWLLRLKLAEVVIASSACVLGPPVAAAVAAGRGWHSLVTPGILCGVLGYAIANFVGVGIGNWLN